MITYEVTCSRSNKCSPVSTVKTKHYSITYLTSLVLKLLHDSSLHVTVFVVCFFLCLNISEIWKETKHYIHSSTPLIYSRYNGIRWSQKILYLVANVFFFWSFVRKRLSAMQNLCMGKFSSKLSLVYFELAEPNGPEE